MRWIITRVAIPPPEAVAELLGGRRAGANDWRIAHLCAGETGAPGANPGLSIRRAPAGHTVARCYYGCAPRDTYAALRRALNLDGAGAYIPPPAPAPARQQDEKPRRPWRRPVRKAPAALLITGTGWPLLSGAEPYKAQLAAIPGTWTAWAPYILKDGRRRDKIRPFPGAPDERKTGWDRDLWNPDGTRRYTAGLTPLVWQDIAGAPLVITEGESPAAAIVSSPAGARYAVASIDGEAGWLNANFAPVVAGRRVLVWPDADGAGTYSARRGVERILDAGAAGVQVVSTQQVLYAVHRAGGTMRGADAADVPPAAISALLDATLYAPDAEGAPDDAPDDGARGIVAPPIPPEMRCLDMGHKYRDARTPDGEQLLTPFPCYYCDRCLARHNALHQLRYDARVRQYPIQTLVTARVADIDAADAFRRAQGRRDDGARCSVFYPMSIADGAGVDVSIIYAAGLSERAAETTRRAMARAGLDGDVQTRPVSGAEFRFLLPDTRSAQGESGAKHNVVSFSDRWGYPILDVDGGFAADDGVVRDAPDGAPRITRPQVPAKVALRRAMHDPDTCDALDAGDWMALMETDIPRAAFDALVAVKMDPAGDPRPEVAGIRIATGYTGPAKLLTQTAEAAAGLRPRKPAHQVVHSRIAPAPVGAGGSSAPSDGNGRLVGAIRAPDFPPDPPETAHFG